jgi:hypothetical protein
VLATELDKRIGTREQLVDALKELAVVDIVNVPCQDLDRQLQVLRAGQWLAEKVVVIRGLHYFVPIGRSNMQSETLPWDGADAGPADPRAYLGMGKNWENGNYRGGSSVCYQNEPLQPMFPRQRRWLDDSGSGLGGGWWPTGSYNGGVLLKPANWCPAAWYSFDHLAPYGLKGR